MTGQTRRQWVGSRLNTWFGKQRKAWLISVGAAAPVVTFLVGHAPSRGWYWLLVLPAGMAFYSAYGLSTRTSIAEVSAERARADQIVAIDACLLPLVTVCGKVLSAPRADRAAIIGEVKTMALAVARDLVGPDQAASCLYALEVKDGKARLLPESHLGRSLDSRTVFTLDDARGRSAIMNVIALDEPRLVPDIADDEFLKDVADTRSYRGYVAAGVSCQGAPYGMITVDTKETGALAEHDRDLLKLIGAILGLACCAQQHPDGHDLRKLQMSLFDGTGRPNPAGKEES